MLKKVISVFLCFGFCGLTLLLAQEENLAELAKKERERRESLKGKKVRVVTNRDLEKLTKAEALTLPPQSEGGETAGLEARPLTLTQDESQARTPATVHRVTVENPPAQSPQGSGGNFPDVAQGRDAADVSLEEAWKKAQEYVELLTLKLNSLWAQFYGWSDMKTKDYIQMQISETYEKLTKAQEEEARLRQQYEKQVNRKKSESASPLWIK
ncbi:MAG: hypothetical protein NUW07_09125 [Candidatus Saccharicenans sp.]|jgi:hypothetical protein|nr:hypothetical protein [Candidatus Saccharicenans sp.]MDH7493186.1 hypothetical protein [Candidatus Saccharicenans sp.]